MFMKRCNGYFVSNSKYHLTKRRYLRDLFRQIWEYADSPMHEKYSHRFIMQ